MGKEYHKVSDLRVDEAFGAVDSGDYSRAISIYTELIQKHDVSELYNQRGLAYVANDNFQCALDDFAAAISKSPSDPDCYINRANVFLRLKSYEKAIVDYTVAISLSPKNPVALNGRGFARFKTGFTQGAFDDLWKAVALDGSCVSPLFNLGLVCDFLGKFEEAQTFLSRALVISPDDTDIARLLSKVELKLARRTEKNQ